MPATRPTLETDEAYGARIMTSVVCCECGSAEWRHVAPGHEGYRVDLLGGSDDAPGRSFALTRDQPVRAWCAACWPWRPQNTAGSARGATATKFPTAPAGRGRVQSQPAVGAHT